MTLTLPEGSWTVLLGSAEDALGGEATVEGRSVLIVKN